MSSQGCEKGITERIAIPYRHEEKLTVAKKAKKTAKRRTRESWTKAHLRELKVHSKAKTAVKKVAKIMKRTEGVLRQKAYALGIRLGHRR
jgi:hypothetical protein